MGTRRAFAFDFAEVITLYDGNFESEEVITQDVPNAEVEAMRTLKSRGHTIIIHSTLSDKSIANFCIRHNIPYDYINKNPKYSEQTGNPGKPVASVYIDDRAYCYKGQKSNELVEALESFEPYYKNLKNNNQR